MNYVIEPYVNFDGNALQAFTFYQRVFNAPEPFLMRIKDIPEEDQVGWENFDENAIMHGSLNLGAVNLMGSDSLMGESPRASTSVGPLVI